MHDVPLVDQARLDGTSHVITATARSEITLDAGARFVLASVASQLLSELGDFTAHFVLEIVGVPDVRVPVDTHDVGPLSPGVVQRAHYAIDVGAQFACDFVACFVAVH